MSIFLLSGSFVPPEFSSTRILTTQSRYTTGNAAGIVDLLVTCIRQTADLQFGINRSITAISHYRNNFRIACTTIFTPSFRTVGINGNPLLCDDTFQLSLKIGIIIPCRSNLAAESIIITTYIICKSTRSRGVVGQIIVYTGSIVLFERMIWLYHPSSSHVMHLRHAGRTIRQQSSILPEWKHG